MATPPSGAENAMTKVAKDRTCPFCQHAFTSSSLGRHLDLYIKSKNPKPPDGIHNVDEIRKMRGNITRRQSRVASGVKRDASSTPAGPASASYASYDEKAASAPNLLGKPGWSINRLSWEATGVINDLPPRIEPRPSTDRRDSSKREQLKADLDQRQKLADELDTGRAAQLALKEILDTVRNAEASATGRHLFDDFDFFQQTFPCLCLRLLSPAPLLDSSLSISASDSWSSNIPWDQQRDALSRIVEERAQLLRRRSSLSSSASDEASSTSLNLDKFYRHIDGTFEHWKSIPEDARPEVWQREIIRGYVRIEDDLKEARNTIKMLRREAEFLAKRLERASMADSPYTPAFSDRRLSTSVPPSPLGISDDILRDLCKQGVNVREWDYERLLDRWKNVVRDERRASMGLSAQRNFPTSQHARVLNAAANLSVNGVDSTVASRSASITSAMSATAPTRTSSMDSAALDADAEGEDEDMDEGIAPDAHPYSAKPQRLPPSPPLDVSTAPQQKQPQPPPPQPVSDTRLPGMYVPPQAQVDQNYKWPQQHAEHTSTAAAATTATMTTTATATATPYTQLPDPAAVSRLPPGPDSWRADFRAAGHDMEGLQGPATAGAPASTG